MELDEAAVKAALLALKAQLEEESASGRELGETVELDQARVGRLSRMDALQTQAMSKEAERRRRLALRRIDAALTRLGQGEYGLCVTCGEPIGAGRLRLDPAVTQCIDCASKAESP